MGAWVNQKKPYIKIKCSLCGEVRITKSNLTKYCITCSKARKNRQDLDSKRESRESRPPKNGIKEMPPFTYKDRIEYLVEIGLENTLTIQELISAGYKVTLRKEKINELRTV